MVIREEKEQWFLFKTPPRIIETSSIAEVIPCLEEIERLVSEGFYAAGFLSYEAGPAFDSSFKAHELSDFPLLWFGVYEKPARITLPSPSDGSLSALGWQPSIDPADYETAVRKIKMYIEQGDTYQVNFSFRLHAEYCSDPWNLFCAVSNVHQMPFSSYIDTGESVVCSFSPELFFSLDGFTILTRPMKGTAPRGRFLQEDKEQALKLCQSEKDRAENLMIVDMMRNDLSRIARKDSITVPHLFTVEKYPSLLQMTSTISAQTEKRISELFGALFPCASITGAPKVRTTQIIHELESAPRKLYCGTLGYIAPQRKARFSVAIRTMLLDTREHRAEYSTGSGIVWDSDTGNEYAECLLKADLLTKPLSPFCLIETIRWTPEEGYFLLENHLKRLQDTATYFQFTTDCIKIRAFLEELARGLTHPTRVRILIASDGTITSSQTLLHYASKTLRVALKENSVHSSNRFLFHKTTNRTSFEQAMAYFPGCDDVILVNEKGQITEMTIGNIVVELHGKLITPQLHCGLLPGVFRAELLEKNRITEEIVTPAMLEQCSRIYRINSVRLWERCELVTA